MANLKLRYLIIVILLALTASAVNGLQYKSSLDDEAGLTDLQAIPMQIGEWWEGKDFPLDEMVYEILDTKAIIHRSFTDKNDNNVFLSIVHYADTKIDFHAPEGCLGGQGINVETKNKSLFLQSDDKKIALNVAKMVTERETGNSLTYYFYKSGEFVGNNYIKMRLSIAANKLFRNDSRGSLIRISTTITPNKEKEAEVLLVGFLQDFFPYIHESL